MTTRFNMWIPDDLMERIRQLAELEEVSAAALIKRLARQYVDGCDFIALEKRVTELERKFQEKFGG